MAALIQVLQQGAIEEAAVGAAYQALMGGKLGQHWFHEGDDAVAGIGAAGAQLGLDDLLGRGAEDQQRMIGQGAALMRVVAFGRPFLTTLDGLDGGIRSEPLLRLEADARAPNLRGPRPHPLAQHMIQGLQFADVAFADFLEQPPEGGVIRYPLPARQASQHLIAPHGDALAEAAGTADETDHDQIGGIDQAIDGIHAPLMTHLLPKQGGETQVVQKLNHRGQPPLTGVRRTRRAIVDLGRCATRRPAAVCAMFAHGKGDASG